MIAYHYCSLNAFLNILKNKQLFLSDPLKMNDSMELIWYLDKLRDEWIEFRKYELPFNFQNHKVEYDPEISVGSLLDLIKMYSKLENISAEDLKNCIKKRGQDSIYIGCFSKEPDKLSQWRSYGDDGKGVSIGFDLEKLQSADNIFVQEVLYTDSVLYKKVGNDIQNVAMEVGSLCNEFKIGSEDERMQLLIHELIPEVAKYKNPTFQEENEVRLIYCEDLKYEKLLDTYGVFEEKSRFMSLDHDFRITNNNQIIEFVKLDFDIDAIKEIYIGPNCLVTRYEIMKILKNYQGNNVDVVYSKSSYRK